MRIKSLLISIIILCSGCSDGSDDFYLYALGNPSTKIKVISSHSEIVDNLFKSEYSWLLNVENNQVWLKSLTKSEVSKNDYDFTEISRHLLSTFPNTFNKNDDLIIYRAGEGENGREHYILTNTEKKYAIYYINTI